MGLQRDGFLIRGGRRAVVGLMSPLPPAAGAALARALVFGVLVPVAPPAGRAVLLPAALVAGPRPVHQLHRLAMVDGAILVTVQPIQETLQPLGQLVLADLAVAVGVMTHQEHDHHAVLLLAPLPLPLLAATTHAGAPLPLLDRLTHRCHIFDMNGESYRFRQSAKNGKVGKKNRPLSPPLRAVYKMAPVGPNSAPRWAPFRCRLPDATYYRVWLAAFRISLARNLTRRGRQPDEGRSLNAKTIQMLEALKQQQPKLPFVDRLLEQARRLAAPGDGPPRPRRGLGPPAFRSGFAPGRSDP